MKTSIFWFRRDLRLNDNRALNEALKSGMPVMPLFIFDTNLIDELGIDDPRISFIYKNLSSINKDLRKSGSSILISIGDPLKIWKELIKSYDIHAVFVNKDYEPYAIKRDNDVEALLKVSGIPLFRFRDQVIFEENELVKADGKPYTVFTPYRNKWHQKLTGNPNSLTVEKNLENPSFLKISHEFPSIDKIGFRKSTISVSPFNLSIIKEYHKYRNIPATDKTSYLSPHLRFGTVSIREIVKRAIDENMVFLNELIWREFFMQILYHFPGVVTDNFKPAYNDIRWINDDKDFDRWSRGETGYPMVDAGMRQLNQTGYMHNKVRMITAGFLCKHLLTDWRRGEAYFAQKLLDYELSSNNGNWQWAAGTGCDAAPYFRVFNPDTQQKKFDPQFEYIRKWIPEFGKTSYPDKMIDHNFARQRAIETYKTGIKRKS
jgi:deoxyribodipyrimidine photo-lyase